MVKPGLAEPQFPTVQAFTRRSIPEAATPHDAFDDAECGRSLW